MGCTYEIVSSEMKTTELRDWSTALDEMSDLIKFVECELQAKGYTQEVSTAGISWRHHRNVMRIMCGDRPLIENPVSIRVANLKYLKPLVIAANNAMADIMIAVEEARDALLSGQAADH